ncbi:triose-phosphate isomerase [bacterium]|nr:triose-phosphate isomerase [bacterium]
MRKMIIAGNWKMYKTIPDALNLIRTLKPKLIGEKEVEVIICPPFNALSPLAEILVDSPIKLGAQNMHWEEEGAFTGEISGKMLLTSRVSHVILGHSERRKFFCEDDEIINRKVRKALETGLIPILCIGESLEEREANQTLKVLENQLLQGLSGIEIKDPARLIIAYEPVWAIGTGRNATPAQAQEAHLFIRDLLNRRYETEIANNINILYGGSVKPANALELLRQPDVDGSLVGGASLKAEDFFQIIQAGKEVCN